MQINKIKLGKFYLCAKFSPNCKGKNSKCKIKKYYILEK